MNTPLSSSHNDSVPPYIGVTDFRTPEHVEAALGRLDPEMPQWKLMVGVMATMDSLDGFRHKWEEVWLKPQDFPTVFLDDPRAFNVPHWADYEGQTRIKDLERLLTLCDGKAHALQLDMSWPDPDLVIELQKSFDVPIILQVGRRAMDELGIAQSKVRSLLERIDGYRTHVSGILLDMSGGEGIRLNPDYLSHYVEAIYKERPDITVAVAGGLGPDTVELVDPLLEQFPRLSRDAQSKLRHSGKNTDPLDWECVDQYLARSVAQNRRFVESIS